MVFAVSESYPLLLGAAFVGTVSPSTNDNTPFSGVEQAILAQACPPTGTRGLRPVQHACPAGGGARRPGRGRLGLQAPRRARGRRLRLYAALAVLTALPVRRLSPAVEARRTAIVHDGGDATADAAAPGPASRLAGLFAVDAFAGGLAVQAILALWLQQRYGASAAELGLLFFATNLLSAFSQALAPALAGRRGLLVTMLVPHSGSACFSWPARRAQGLRRAAALLWPAPSLSKIDVPHGRRSSLRSSHRGIAPRRPA